MHLSINGERKDVGSVSTVSDLLRSLGIAEGRVAVELNLTIVKRDLYSSARLTENDTLEIVQFVGGGR